VLTRNFTSSEFISLTHILCVELLKKFSTRSLAALTRKSIEKLLLYSKIVGAKSSYDCINNKLIKEGSFHLFPYKKLKRWRQKNLKNKRKQKKGEGAGRFR